MQRPLPPERWAVVASRFHAVVADRLVEGAVACLGSHGVGRGDIDILRVPGAFELPQAIGALVGPGTALLPRHRGVVALGCVIRGETPHFDVVCSETARGLLDVALRGGLALGFGLLTCDSMEQALARAGGDKGDKGWEAAEAAWDLAGVLDRARSLREGPAS